MKLTVPTRSPFSFAQTLAFVRRFLPCRGDYVIDGDALTAAVMLDGKAVPFTLREARGGLAVECPDGTEPEAIVARAAHLVGAGDDLAPFYAAAEGDPPMRGLIEALHGLHHVRFLTLGEIAVYCVMMQRASIERAAGMKRRFLDRFGIPVETAGGVTLRAMPAMDALVALDGPAIAEAIGHRGKGDQIAGVVRGVAAIGETFLREAPYAAARDALLAIHGVGPFSAGAILLRGLGRMDELPWGDAFDRAATTLYGRTVVHREIEARYGRAIGYWAFYLRTGAARIANPARVSTPTRRTPARAWAGGAAA